MRLTAAVEAPLRRAKRRLRETLFEYAGFYTNYNVADAHIATGGEGFLIRLCAGSWSCCLDVGANAGDYAQAVLAVSPQCRVVCFEPIPALAERLAGAILPSHPQCEVVPALVGASSGEATFHVNLTHHAHSSLHRSSAQTEPIRVGQMTLDAYCAHAGISYVDCCKIDTEGNEMAVLQGMTGLLQANAVGMIQFEYGEFSRSAGTTFRAFYDLLDPHYRICHIVPGGLLPVRYDRRIEKFPFSNWVAFSRDRYG